MNEGWSLLWKYAGQAGDALFSNSHIWAPVFAGIVISFLYSRYLFNKDGIDQEKNKPIMRQAEKDFRCYMLDFCAALVLYVAWNLHSGTIAQISQQATTAGVVAVAIPYLAILAYKYLRGGGSDG